MQTKKTKVLKTIKKPQPVLDEKILPFPCLVLNQGKYKLVVFKTDPEKLWSIVDINKRDPDKKSGYQRILSPARVEALADFIKAGNPIPNSILIAFDGTTGADGATLSLDMTTLFVPNRSDAGWVIDGQHRLVAAHLSEVKIEILVAAFIGLNLQDQVRQFVTINREAKGVPTSLYYDLLKQLPPGKNAAEVSREKATEIADILKVKEESPFFGKITVLNSPGRGELSLTNFVRKIAPLVNPDKGRLKLFSHEEQTQIIHNYFLALKNLFPDYFVAPKPLFMQTLGFGAWMNVFPYVFDLTFKESGGGFSITEVSNVLVEYRSFDFSDWESRGSGSQAEIDAGADLYTHIRLYRASGDVSISIRL